MDNVNTQDIDLDSIREEAINALSSLPDDDKVKVLDYIKSLVKVEKK